MIEARRLSKRYGDKTAVDGVSFSVMPGTVTGFLGPNGAGTSTTMRMIVGLDRPTAGAVTVNGKSYSSHPAPLQEVGVPAGGRVGGCLCVHGVAPFLGSSDRYSTSSPARQPDGDRHGIRLRKGHRRSSRGLTITGEYTTPLDSGRGADPPPRPRRKGCARLPLPDQALASPQ